MLLSRTDDFSCKGMASYSRLEQEVDSVADLIWDVASHVWEYAEVVYKEYKSSAYVFEASVGWKPPGLRPVESAGPA